MVRLQLLLLVRLVLCKVLERRTGFFFCPTHCCKMFFFLQCASLCTVMQFVSAESEGDLHPKSPGSGELEAEH